jgi:GT2 family glycosyltransferase
MTKNIKANQDITIIIVTYKSSHIILQTIKNIVNKGFKIIIVDNGSNDNIAEILDQNIKNNYIELIEFENNCGFSRANNYALKKVNSKYALLINPDCFIDINSIKLMATEMDKDINIAMANPRFVSNIDKKIATTLQDSIEETPFIVGTAMMMRMEIFHKIGFFDEAIFLYGEDNEISVRARNYGYKLIIVNNAFSQHLSQKSSKVSGNLQEIKLLYFRNYHQGWGKTYIKRKNKSIIRLAIKALHRLMLSIYYLIFKLNKEKAIIRLALSMGSIANMIGIDCFNKNNKIIKIKNYK